MSASDRPLGKYAVKDLAPGDVLRHPITNKPLVVAGVVGDPTNPEVCLIEWAGGLEPTLTRWDATVIGWETNHGLGGRYVGGCEIVAAGPGAHYPVCSLCGEVWPCIHQRADDALYRAEIEALYQCHHCRKGVTGKRVRVLTVTDRGLPKELLFHGRKGPCLTAARRLDPTVAPR
jgi:hypothetical protein